jgi:hypothetical protein
MNPFLVRNSNPCCLLSQARVYPRASGGRGKIAELPPRGNDILRELRKFTAEPAEFAEKIVFILSLSGLGVLCG